MTLLGAETNRDVSRWSRWGLIVVLVSAAAAWAGVIAVWREMGATPGTMGLDPAEFCVVWTLMMAAMMLPSVAPFASFYTRTLTSRRGRRVVAFASGYLLVWASAGVPAFGLAWIADRLVADHATAATALAVCIFAACGVYQLTTLKDRCLAQCRSPLGFTLKYGSYQGRGRDLRAGVLHGGFCLGCCWALMVLLVAFGLMNVVAMVAIATIVVIEKTHPRGIQLSRVVGIAAMVFAALVVVHPALAPGLYRSPSHMTNGSM